MKRNLPLLYVATVSSLLAAVDVQRLPSGAVQPLVVTDDTGTVHLVWLQGDPKACDVFYRRLPGGSWNGSGTLQVNRQSGSAIAIGTIRGAQLAVGKNGRVHVVWNGSSLAEPKSVAGVPLLYSRLNDSGTAFEPEQNLMGRTAALDWGASVAADRSGNVYVVWHAAPAADREGEPERRVFLARSADDGVSFQSERSISLTNGVCGCCALRAFAARDGKLLVLYRAAPSLTDRHMTLLASSDHGVTFNQLLTDPWTIAACPMSSASLVDRPQDVFAAWETEGKIQATVVPSGLKDPFAATPVSIGVRAKHPALAVNSRGEALCTWAEGTGWQKGGSVAWRSLDPQGRPVGEATMQPGLPVWSFPAAFAREDGQFVVVF